MQIELVIASIIILIFSIVLHELAHGYTALSMGDPTAKLAGRLTLNPIPHLDPLGSVILPVLLALSPSPFIIGWAKPVPYNPYNLSNQRWGEAIVAFAGPLTNLAIALIFGLGLRFAIALDFANESIITITSFIVFINILLGIFNLIPFPAFDGAKVLRALLPSGIRFQFEKFEANLARFGTFSFFFFILIFFFILWPFFFQFVIFLFTLITGVSLF